MDLRSELETVHKVAVEALYLVNHFRVLVASEAKRRARASLTNRSGRSMTLERYGKSFKGWPVATIGAGSRPD